MKLLFAPLRPSFNEVKVLPGHVAKISESFRFHLGKPRDGRSWIYGTERKHPTRFLGIHSGKRVEQRSKHQTHEARSRAQEIHV
jgi:hypothetical protein